MGKSDPVTEANNRGQADSAADSKNDRGWGGAVFDVIAGNPYYNPPDDKAGKEAYDSGWHNGKK